MLSGLNVIAWYGGAQEWLIVALVLVVLFGGAKIPQLARGFGEGIREFKKSINGEESTPGGNTTGDGEKQA